MNSAVEMFAKLNVTAASPDRSVTARFAHRGGFAVTFNARLAAEHTEDSLAAQLTHAVNDGLAGYRAALNRIDVEVDRFLGGDAEARRERRKTSRRLPAAQCANLESRAVSPKGYAGIRFRKLDEVDCRIRPGTLSRAGFTFPKLGEEVAAAYYRAKSRYVPPDMSAPR